MNTNRNIQYKNSSDNHSASEPLKNAPDSLGSSEMLINLGPQHPATHGVLRLEVIAEGEVVREVVPHIGYLHRCFEKHAEKLSYQQIIPYIDRMDYLAAMNSEHIYAEGMEKILGIKDKIHPRIEFIRILLAELNRLASHFVAVGTYAIDLGAVTPFLWMMRDREHISRMFEWVSGARMLFNYIWVGGLYYDLPLHFEEKVAEFCRYLLPKIDETVKVLLENKIFISRTANIGVLPLQLAVNAGASGPVLRASGLKADWRIMQDFSRYAELDFDIPVGRGKVGTIGDCWDRTSVRVEECRESVKIIRQCVEILLKKYPRSRDFDPQANVPRKIRPASGTYFFNGESPRGELGFFIAANAKSDKPERMKVRAPSFCNLSLLQHISKGVYLADLVAITGSIDIVLGEIDR
jgi:NADH-quinone oxidoreductase subunit D